VEYGEVVGVPDDLWSIFHLVRLDKGAFHAVQGDVHQQGRDHASYNVAKKVLAFVYQVAIPRSHLRASYGDGFQGAPVRCKKRQEEGSFTRGSGVCDEQAFSQEHQDRGGAEHV
jgi:hypothetical protein